MRNTHKHTQLFSINLLFTFVLLDGKLENLFLCERFLGDLILAD